MVLFRLAFAAHVGSAVRWLPVLGMCLSAADVVGQGLEFNRDIRPLLADRCYRCHGPDKGHRKAGLRLDLPGSAFAEREGRFAIVPGHPERSELVVRITSADPKQRMPPRKSHKTLSGDEIQRLTQWVREGAKYEAHWSYTAPRTRPAPRVRDRAWAQGDIDRWVLSAMERAGRSPSPSADPITLVRRLSFDLTGLPPSIAEVEAFVQDRRADKYERLVDRLLSSTRYGERMAMYWLDLVRYADTVGYHGDQAHSISPYRDYVIRAFADNMPFDQFTIEQLAGDLLETPGDQQKIATGYNRVLQTSHEGGVQAKEYLAIYAADRVRNVAEVWLGATLGCAQCHDHKYDPYTMKDFYSMSAFFADIQELGDFKGSPNSNPTTRPPEMVLLDAAGKSLLAQLDKERAALHKRGKQSPDARARIKALDAQRKKLVASGRRCMITVSKPPRKTRVLARGDWMDDSGEEVLPAVPHFLPQLKAQGRRATRLDLARWLVADRQPLTARVFVNRVWYLFFGAGLSADLADFGAQGSWPDHPELLDALAVQFVASGWDVKALVRSIVSSRAYRQSSIPRPEGSSQLADRRSLAVQSRWRLPAEMIRDNALAVSGLLVESVGGDSVKPYQPAGYYRHLNFPARKYRHHTDQRQWRRGVYMHWQRMFLHPALKAFDAPTREECTPARPVSNTPQAALTLLNDPTFVEAARVMACRLLAFEGSAQDRLAHGFRLATSRSATSAEVGVLQGLLRRQRARYRQDRAAAKALVGIGLASNPQAAAGVDATELASWTAVTRVLLNLHETTTRN